jgi:hypothetical protein
MELAHRRRTGLGSYGESPSEIVRTLKNEGYTHLMLCPPGGASAIEFDPTLCRLLSPWLTTQVPLFRENLADPDGVMREYTVYELTYDDIATRGSQDLTR